MISMASAAFFTTLSSNLTELLCDVLFLNSARKFSSNEELELGLGCGSGVMASSRVSGWNRKRMATRLMPGCSAMRAPH